MANQSGQSVNLRANN